MTDITLPQRLKARRLHLGIDQSELAEAIDRSRPLIAAMENGNSAITVDQLAAFADVLSVKPGYFFGDYEGLPPEESELMHAYLSLSEHGRKLAFGAIIGMLKSEEGNRE